MPEVAELSAVLRRTRALELLTEHARLERCGFAVLDARRTALSSSAGDDVAALIAEASAATAPVDVFDRNMGWVVALNREGASENAARRVAERAASVLADLCACEYELNDLSREILAAYEELNVFYQIAEDLADAPHADAVCRVVLARALHVVRSRAARIMVRTKGSSEMRVVASLGHGADEAPVSAAGGETEEALVSRRVRLLEDEEQLASVDRDVWESAATHSLVTIPVQVSTTHERRPVGVLQLRDRIDAADGSSAPFSSGDLKLAQAVASQAALLVEHSRLIGMERELQLARDIQCSLLPAEPPRASAIEIAGECIAASNVGGDYYDFVELDEDRFALILADVSGHNLAAALIQTAARATVRAAILEDPAPKAVLDRVNRAMMTDLERAGLFLTAWYADIDAASGSVVFADAGHHPALHYVAAERRVVDLGTGGLPIGVTADGGYDEHRVDLDGGDVVLIYTDGLSEARAGDLRGPMLGASGVASALERHASLPADKIVAAILADVDAYAAGSPGDDRTLVVLKRTPTSSR